VTTAAVRIGLIGCGRLAERGYLPALESLPALRLVAVADPDRARRAALAAAAGVATSTAVASAEELVALDADLDGVLIASPVSSHVAAATVVAHAGLRSLVEKPPAPTAGDATPLLELDPAPWVAFNRRFDPDARRVRALVPDGAPIGLDLRLHYRRPSWGAHRVCDDALLDLGPHLVDWATWLSRRSVLEVESQEVTTDRARVRLALEGGGHATIDAATNRPHEERIALLDGHGRKLATHRAGGIVAAVRARARRPSPDRLVATLRAELEAFAGALRHPEGAHGLGSVAEGLRVMTILDAARASAVHGAAVSVAEAVAS
jgi:predicted dehydrogenase